MAIRNPFKPAPLNNVTSIPCPHGHLRESAHPKYRFAPDIGWFVWSDDAQAFLWSARPFGDDRFAASREEGKVKRGALAYIWCICDMPQVSVDSIPGTKEPKTAHTGFGAHWHAYADPAVLKHLRSYLGSDIQPGSSQRSGKWVLGIHDKDTSI